MEKTGEGFWSVQVRQRYSSDAVDVYWFWGNQQFRSQREVEGCCGSNLQHVDPCLPRFVAIVLALFLSIIL